MMNEKKYRYLGVKPFEATNRTIFFGRNTDIEGLFNLILSEKLVVLFGKSGYGKSSLLNAGVLPLFQESEEPERRAVVIEVRLGTFVNEQTRTPLKTVLAKLREKLPEILEKGGNNLEKGKNNLEKGGNNLEKGGNNLEKGQNTEGASAAHFLDALYPNEAERPLWYHVKRRQAASPNGRFVVVFDQFEEFFTYPETEQELFKRELAELLYSDIPQNIRKHLPKLTAEAKQQLAQPMNVQAVFSIRADRISLLDSMTTALPAILHKRYELRSLTPEQAREAIVKPAALDKSDFATPPFAFTEAALQKILTELSSGQTKGVEAFQLQILCQFIESQVQTGVILGRNDQGLAYVDVKDLPDMSNLYETYYRRQLDRLDALSQRPAQVVLEEGLLAEDAQSGEGRRMSVDSQFLKSQFSVDDALLRALENTYLVRKEPNSVGGESLEISHDTLVAPVLKMKKERRAKEELAASVKREAEAARLAAVERRRRQQSNLLAGAAVVGLMVAGWQYYNANNATKLAEKARIEAESQRNAANTALQKVIAARKEKMRTQIVADENAQFFESAKRNRVFLEKIESLEKQHIEPSLILSDIEAHLSEIQK
jgi:hypothetical protein